MKVGCVVHVWVLFTGMADTRGEEARRMTMAVYYACFVDG